MRVLEFKIHEFISFVALLNPSYINKQNNSLDFSHKWTVTNMSFCTDGVASYHGMQAEHSVFRHQYGSLGMLVIHF